MAYKFAIGVLDRTFKVNLADCMLKWLRIRTLNSRLVKAAREGLCEQVEELLTAGAKVNATDNEGNTALCQCLKLSFDEREEAWEGRKKVFDLLLEKGADPNLRERSGNTPLILAFDYSLGMAEVLIEKGADVNARGQEGLTPLMAAVREWPYSRELTSRLLGLGVNIHAKNKAGMNVLMIAAERGNLELVQYLIDNGSDGAVVGPNNMRAIDFAAQNGHRDCVDCLGKSFGAEIRVVPRWTHDELNEAASKGDVNRTMELLRAGANPNWVGENRYTPLIMAACSGHVAVMEVLLDNGALINYFDDYYKHTALIKACIFGHAEVVRLLLSKGADPTIVDYERYTALDYAKKYNRQNIAELLK